MTTAREIMTSNPIYLQASDSVHEAAKRMAEHGIGSVPIRGEDNKLKGMLTDRDIVIKVIAADRDARAMHAGELAQGEAVIVNADDSAEHVLAVMTEKQVRRLPVVDGGDLVGIVAQADVARALREPTVGNLVEALSVDYR